MRFARLIHIASIALIFGVSCFASGARAEPALDRLLQSVQVSNQKQCTAISISFNFRVRYLNHFPATSGRELRISVRALDPLEAASEVVTRRESLRAPQTRFGRLRSIDFEVLNAAGPVLTVLFEQATNYRVSQGDDFQSIVVEIFGPKGPGKCSKVFASNGGSSGWATTVNRSPIAPQTPSGTSTPKIPKSSGTASDTQIRNAAAWLDEGRAALKKEKYQEAIAKFTEILKLPETPSSPDALEYLGVARQKQKQFAAAAATYEEYLSRYPSGEGADRVRQRLAAVQTVSGDAPSAELKKPSGTERGRYAGQTWTLSGSASQFYVRDDSFRTLRDPSLPVTVNEELDLHDVHQNELLTSLDAVATWNSDGIKNKLRFSGTHEHAFDDDSGEIIGVAALFLDTSIRDWGTEFRVGRQTRNTGGVLGRFDGAVLSYDVTPSVRLNGVVGSPVNRRVDIPYDDEQLFYGLSADFGIAANLDATVFAIEQRDRDILDRQAVGAELRYNDESKSAFATVDYDIHYQVLNAAILTGSWTLPNKSNIHGAFDYRKSPYLSTWTALQGDIYPSLYSMLRSNTLAEVEEFALERTSSFASGSAGFSQPLTETFQFNFDATVTNFSGTDPSGGLPAVEGTGNEYFLNAQLVGNGVIDPNDLFVAAFRFADLDQSDYYVIDLSARYPVMDNVKINPRLLLGYRTGDETDLEEFTVLPSVLVDYYVMRDFAFEVEVGASWTDSKVGGVEETSTDLFFTIGYRYDFYADGSSASPSRSMPYGIGVTR